MNNGWVGATVILQGGKRLGWKISRGYTPLAGSFNSRYFGPFRAEDCAFESASFTEPNAFEKAAEWARAWPRHESAGGQEP